MIQPHHLFAYFGVLFWTNNALEQAALRFPILDIHVSNLSGEPPTLKVDYKATRMFLDSSFTNSTLLTVSATADVIK